MLFCFTEVEINPIEVDTIIGQTLFGFEWILYGILFCLILYLFMRNFKSKRKR